MARVHILGASGSGTTTLAAALAARLGVPHVDADRLFWTPTDPPFTTRRPAAERLAMLTRRLPITADWVFSGSATGWGAPIEPFYDLIVLTRLDPAARMERLRRRERERYGARIAPGGDMEAASAAFLEWAAAYDTAGLEQRSRVAHEAWLASQTAPALRLDSSGPVDDLVAAILGRLDADAGRRHVDGVEGYVEHADTLAARFESVAFADVHRVVLPLLPDPPRDVIDIGAGTGRDAAALAAMGHRVVAVEPVAALRAHGRRLHPSPAIAWLDDSLPDLRATLALGRSFDVVLVSAVWMHLDAGQRRRAMPRVAALLRPGAIAIVSLRHGPVPAGRRMFAVSADETCALAHALGLETIHRSERDSAYGPSDVRWSVLAFRRGA